MTALAFESEGEVDGLLLRWVRAPACLHEDCDCGQVDVLLVSAPGAGLWSPVATVPLSLVMTHEEALASIVTEVGEGWGHQTAVLSAAFGMPWGELSLLMVRGMFTLMDVLDPRLLEFLHSLDSERVLAMRAACPRPAMVVRALQVMRDHAAGVQ